MNYSNGNTLPEWVFKALNHIRTECKDTQFADQMDSVFEKDGIIGLCGLLSASPNYQTIFRFYNNTLSPGSVNFDAASSGSRIFNMYTSGESAIVNYPFKMKFTLTYTGTNTYGGFGPMVSNNLTTGGKAETAFSGVGVVYNPIANAIYKIEHTIGGSMIYTTLCPYTAGDVIEWICEQSGAGKVIVNGQTYSLTVGDLVNNKYFNLYTDNYYQVSPLYCNLNMQ